MESIFEFLPSVGTIVAVILALLVAQRVLRMGEAKVSGHRFRNIEPDWAGRWARESWGVEESRP